MAANSQQFSTRLDTLSRHVNEINVLSLEQQLARLTSLVRQMVVGNMQTVKACGICSVAGHPTNMCPTLQEDEQVNRQPYLSRQQRDQTSSFGMSLEDIVKSLATNTLQFQQETKQFQQEARANIKSLDNQMREMATGINGLEAQGSGKLPSRTIVNPRENACAITLRSGKEVEILVKIVPTSSKQQKEKDVTANTDVPNDNNITKHKFLPLSDYKSVPPFPLALVGYRKDERDHELYDTFGRCEINIPLIDVIKKILHYVKFLKHLCKSKRKQKLKGCEKVNIRENVYVIIQRKIPMKCTDPGMFTIPCTIGKIGKTNFEKVMIDSGASINAIPYSIYTSLKLGLLNETGIVIQLADKSNAYPKGSVEDILVKVNI
ncbi:uncharacterized protein LOC111394216 [Olea europaea var. sylvestris]|uniref:uncharacterized protein LOC111394216 n=1 Tax=Olea europaea var. sylvestris TaxID=158386 RepID=UPI000C1D83D4|nr:uncharacterized protein LOC111394216 [Olea europaea var. sylvestris]